MARAPRYRSEDGEHCIDVRFANLEQMFDNRDPAPFRERDIDQDLVEYLVAAGEDLMAHRPFRIVFWFANPIVKDRVEPALRAHLEYELERVARRRQRERRAGQVSLLIGALLLVGLVSLAQLVAAIPTVGPIVREGLTISSWVIMWRPIQTLIYDWIPAYRERKVLAALLAARVHINEQAVKPA